jgi:Cu/Ag efflux protein CusF
MVYRSSPDLLKDIKPGDKITFTAKREGDKYVVTQIKI